MKTTVIVNIYNEEFLLPFWLKHHVKLFDHGIIIDWDSTDNSVEIIKKYAPHWEIRKSKVKYFHRGPACEAMLEHELSIDGWKIIFSITDFLFHPDIRGYLNSLPSTVNGVWIPPICLVDEDPTSPLNNDYPLVLQKTYGTIGKNELRPTNKLIHKKPHGEWKGEGHHDSYMKNAFVVNDIFHVHLKWCPWRPEFIKRKLQVQDKMSEEYKNTLGVEELGYHITTAEKQSKEFREKQAKYCNSLFNNPIYSYLYKEIEKLHSDPNYKFNPFLIPDEIEYNLQRLVTQIKSMGLENEYIMIVRDVKAQRYLLNAEFSRGSNRPELMLNIADVIFKRISMEIPQLRFIVVDKQQNSVLIDSNLK